MGLRDLTTAVLGVIFVPMLAAMVFAGCGDGDNKQYLPIGQRCDSSEVCGTRPYNCKTEGYPGGYCQKDCKVDGDCPADALCVGLECRRTCASIGECRSSEGYSCVDLGLKAMVCDVP